ncbi:tetratricopeptide repeat protein [Stella sp.]|uniref:tetratricopeptide repeat protein n=1 Tax=Stella sp. TaxID=2912054 RepID=UPI0035B0400E
MAHRPLLPPLLLALVLGALPAAGQQPRPGNDEYARCMRLARTNATEAFETASAWDGRGGGLPARHCAAVALLTLGQPAEAAVRLERLATDGRGDAVRVRVELLQQAAQAWLAARMPERAHAVLSQAVKIAPDDADLWIDRSVVLATAKNYWEAIDDLNRAIELAPRRAEPLVLRATAYRWVGSLELAEDDLARALSLDPRSADALLERGIVRRLRNDPAGARADWIAVLRLAPDGPAGDAARANLEKLDVRVEPPRR